MSKEKIRLLPDNSDVINSQESPVNWDDYEIDNTNKTWVESWEKSLLKEVEEDIKRYDDIYWGQLMTLIDATFFDPIQRKAFKDSVKNITYGLAELEPQIIPAIKHTMHEMAYGVHTPKNK